ncbi:PREDICTED: E3 ubiquitin-protein ligase RNF213-like, partial [Amphimedon queenslandica]
MASLMEGPPESGELFAPVPYDSVFERHDSIGEYDRQISADSDELQDLVITSSEKTSAEKYLTILALGTTLQQLSLSNKPTVGLQRKFPEGLKYGEPNLLVTPPDKVFKTVLSLYMESKDLPMPTYEEVLICNENTTEEEVTLLWKRAMGDPNHFRIFCLVHAELLSYQVCDKALKSLTECSYAKNDYRLVIVCSDEDLDKFHMISKLQLFKQQLEAFHCDDDYKQYLKSHFVQNPNILGRRALASTIDRENSCVRVVTSDRTGMGKSLYIQRMKEELKSKCYGVSSDVIIPVHGPKVTSDSIVQLLKSSVGNKDTNQAIIFHLDISPNVLRQVDSILFSLLILQAVSGTHGKIWRSYISHLYAIEVSVLKNDIKFAKPTVELLKLLPTVQCLSPRSVCNVLEGERG